ncbi:hypothetical protein B0A52_09740 [Exophiala mesophila]|uniref:Anaphase-promoting complex subunit 4 WD40 domain-containing protein n=1 Tax=Exophiala mesophila TaxID=212818 RepID=A0A438MTS9_EXOME|nr:hypothetical protein B0A52_09740 [Exophiala mesophila]
MSAKCLATALTSETGEDYFRHVQWSADGTCLLAITASNSIYTYVVPPDLMDERELPLDLSVYCKITSNDPVNALTGYPHFDLTDPQTSLVLSARRDLPIKLNSALTGQLGASYPLINPMTEAYICPNSLTFNPVGDRFIAGSESLISIFDLSRPGQEPISALPTGPRRRGDSHHNPAINMRGLISTLAIEPSTHVLAAGTFNRSIGLYESMGDGECIGVFSVKGNSADAAIRGSGVTQISWSPCGRYLYIAERKSDGLHLYDIRKTGQLLAWLEGRNSVTNQRMSFDIFPTDQDGSHEVWAGGIDGKMRVWRNPHHSEGPMPPSSEFDAHNGMFGTPW